jgi:pre-mRNA-processing factor 19
VASEPVVSVKSGHVFERRLIETYLATTGKCPLTAAPLTAADLLPLVSSASAAAQPRLAALDSVPALLKALQKEWDASVLESFQLKQHLDAARQELAHALYQHDAACRVIARLVQERDQAREALKNVQATGLHSQQQPMATDKPDSATTPAAVSGLPADLLASLQEHAHVLMQARSKRSISKTLATQEEIAHFECASSQQLHGTPAGITCMAVSPTDANLVVTGGADGTALVFNHSAQKVAAELVGHSARINSIAVGEQAIVTGSADRTVRVWRHSQAEAAFRETLRIGSHSDEVTAVALHPRHQGVALSASKDATWALHAIDADRDSGAPLFSFKSNSPILSARFHPDGLLVGAGEAHGAFALFDLSTGARALTFDAHQAGVAAVAFSENAFYVATGGASDGSVKLWDLRKNKCLHTVKLEAGYAVRSLQFDDSGVYLAVAGSDARVFAGKTLAHVVTFSDHAAPVTGVVFGKDASFVATASIDRTLRVWRGRK